jgi:hypothetical protein
MSTSGDQIVRGGEVNRLLNLISGEVVSPRDFFYVVTGQDHVGQRRHEDVTPLRPPVHHRTELDHQLDQLAGESGTAHPRLGHRRSSPKLMG